MKVVLLTNILTPFRIFFYDRLFEEYRKNGVEFSVLVMVPNEPGRTWQYENFKRVYTTLLKGSLRKISGIDWIVNTDIKEKIAAENPNIVICAGSYMNPSVWTAIHLKKKYGYKVLFWSESHLNETRSYGKAKLLLRQCIRKQVMNGFDGFWYAGKMSKAFIDCYVKEKKDFIFVPNMIQEDVYFRATQYSSEQRRQLRKDLNIDDKKRMLFMPVRLSKEKGILEFLRILNKSSNKSLVTVAISGDGPLREEIAVKAKEDDLDVRLLGFQDQPHMVNLYAAADIFVMPSLSDPNPLASIEACWAAKPLFVSEHVGNNPETVEHGKNGFVFNYKDESGAVQMLDSMIAADDAWLEKAGAVSLKIAKQKYNSANNIARVAKETLELVKEG